MHSAGLCVTGKIKNRTAPVQGSYFVRKEIIQGGEAVCLFARVIQKDSSCYEGLTKGKEAWETGGGTFYNTTIAVDLALKDEQNSDMKIDAQQWGS